MTVAFKVEAQCTLCGYRLRGIAIETVRVNKRSLKTQGRGLIALGLRHCPECGESTYVDHVRYVCLDRESSEQVRAYRERRWAA